MASCTIVDDAIAVGRHPAVVFVVLNVAIACCALANTSATWRLRGELAQIIGHLPTESWVEADNVGGFLTWMKHNSLYLKRGNWEADGDWVKDQNHGHDGMLYQKNVTVRNSKNQLSFKKRSAVYGHFYLRSSFISK
jgi:hypothetical protein